MLQTVVSQVQSIYLGRKTRFLPRTVFYPNKHEHAHSEDSPTIVIVKYPNYISAESRISYQNRSDQTKSIPRPIPSERVQTLIGQGVGIAGYTVTSLYTFNFLRTRVVKLGYCRAIFEYQGWEGKRERV